MRDILKDLAHVVLEAKKYHNLSSAAGETVMLVAKFSTNQKSWQPGGHQCSSSLSWKSENRKYQYTRKGETVPHHKQRKWIHLLSTFLFYSGPQWIGWSPLSHRRTICFFSLPIQMLISSRKMLDQMSRHCLAYSSWLVQLAITYSCSILKLLFKNFVHLYFTIIFLFFTHHYLYTTFSIVFFFHLAFDY